jgi:hypothetical protein
VALIIPMNTVMTPQPTDREALAISLPGYETDSNDRCEVVARIDVAELAAAIADGSELYRAAAVA